VFPSCPRKLRAASDRGRIVEPGLVHEIPAFAGFTEGEMGLAYDQSNPARTPIQSNPIHHNHPVETAAFSAWLPETTFSLQQ
jgi:hypothetical protein